MIAAVVAVGIAGIALFGRNALNESSSPQSGFDPGAIFDDLRSTPFSRVYVPRGFEFHDVGGTLSPSEADKKRLWLVYAVFEGPVDRAVVAFQVFRSKSRAAEYTARSYQSVCEEDETSWSCAAARGPVSLKGEVECLSPGCIPTRADAKRLLDAGLRHLAELGMS